MILLNDDVKNVFDWASVSMTIATFVGWLPHLAALLSVIWGTMRVYEKYLDLKERKSGNKRNSDLDAKS